MAERFGVFFVFFGCLALVKATEIVTVRVYYESLCPDSERFIQSALEPTYDSICNSIKLELIPYGNAHTKGKPNQYTFKCQHGKEECRGNMIQACAVHLLNNSKESLKFISCAFDQSHQEKSIPECIKSFDSQKKIKKCADGEMGKNLLAKMGNETDSLNPTHNFIPWITFNGKGSDDINNKAIHNFVKTLCSFYTTSPPNICLSEKRKLTDFYHRLVGL